MSLDARSPAVRSAAGEAGDEAIEPELERLREGYGESVSRRAIYIWLVVVAVLIVAWMILVNELGYVR
jgi:hypothetical protein